MTYSMNSPLSTLQSQVNGQYIWDVLRPLGWTKNAVAGMLGNMSIESGVNPGAYQNYDNTRYDLGYGLVQWTPATKYFTWADARGLTRASIDSQLQRIFWELRNGEQWFETSPSFSDFIASTDTAYNLAMQFGEFYERYAGYDTSPQTVRGTRATAWYSFLSGDTTGDTGGGTGTVTGGSSKVTVQTIIEQWFYDTELYSITFAIDDHSNSYLTSLISIITITDGITLSGVESNGTFVTTTISGNGTEFKLKALDKDGNLRWDSSSLYGGDATYILSATGDRLFTYDLIITFGSGVTVVTILRAFDTSDGSVIWERRFDGSSSFATSTFAIDDSNNVYVASKAHGLTNLISFNGDDGTTNWLTPLYDAGTPNTNITTFVDGFMIYGSTLYLRCEIGTTSYYLKAFDTSDGSESWVLGLGGHQFQNQIIDINGNYIFTANFSTANSLYMVDPSGTVLWVNPIGLVSEFITGFIGVDSQRLYVMHNHASVVSIGAYNLSDGSKAWTYVTETGTFLSVRESFLIDEGLLLTFLVDETSSLKSRALWLKRSNGNFVDQQKNLRLSYTPENETDDWFDMKCYNGLMKRVKNSDIFFLPNTNEGLFKLAYGKYITHQHGGSDTPGNLDIIHLLLSDALNGWKH